MLRKLKEQREEADKFMDSIGQQPEPPAEKPAPAEPDPQPVPDAPAEPESAAIPEPTPADNQEITRLQGEIDRLRAQLDDENSQTFRSQALLFKSQRDTAREELRELKEQMKAAPPKPAPAETPETDEDYQTMVAEVGEAAAKIWWKDRQKGKAQQEELSKLVEEKTKPVAEALETVKQDQTVTAQERYYTNLTAKVPDWQEINGGNGKPMDPRFAKFLLETVPLQDYTYNDLLAHHHNAGNASKVAQIFESFKMTLPAPKPADEPKPSELEKHLEPDKTNRGTDTPTDTTKPTYTRAEIELFDKKKRSGTLYGMTKEQIKEKSQLYQTAIFEGRVK